MLVVARIAGPAGLGLYVLALAFGTAVATLARLGMDQAVLRFIPYHVAGGEPSLAAGVARFALRVVLVLGSVGALALFVAAPAIESAWRQPGLGAAVRILALAVPLLALGQVARFGLRAFHDVRLPAALDSVVLPSVAAGLMVAAAWLAPDDPLGPVAATAVALWLVGIAALALFARRLRTIESTPRAVPGTWLRFAAPLAIEGLLVFIVMQGDRLILGVLLDATAVGLFDAAVRLAWLVAVPLAMVNLVLAPAVASLHGSGDRAALQELYARLTWATAALGIGIGVVLAAAGPLLLGLFGPEFGSAQPALILLVLGQAVNVATGSSGIVLAMTGHAGWRLLNAALTAGINIGLDLLLIPDHGVIGAAVATATALGVVNILQVVQVRRLVGVWAYDPVGIRFWVELAADRVSRRKAGKRPAL